MMAAGGNHTHVAALPGGTITLLSDITVVTHHLTIDGSTAPEPGITVTGPGENLVKFHSSAPDTAHDIILRHIRFTDGYDNLRIAGGANNIVVDHCSFRRASDGNAVLNEAGSFPRDADDQAYIADTALGTAEVRDGRES